jgi:ATP-dependent DNA helicase UvrD/PcrA
VPKAAAEDWPAFAKLILRVSTAKKTWPAEFDWVKEWYEPHLHQLYDDAAIRAADLEQLQQIAASRNKVIAAASSDLPYVPDNPYSRIRYG